MCVSLLEVNHDGKTQKHTLPETNIFAPKNGWLDYDRFLSGWPIFRGEPLVSGRVWKKMMFQYHCSRYHSKAQAQKHMMETVPVGVEAFLDFRRRGANGDTPEHPTKTAVSFKEDRCCLVWPILVKKGHTSKPKSGTLSHHISYS